MDNKPTSRLHAVALVAKAMNYGLWLFVRSMIFYLGSHRADAG